MLIKKYKMNWYPKINIKNVNSMSSEECYAGIHFCNLEYCCAVIKPKSYDVRDYLFNKAIPNVLATLEKVHFLNNGQLPGIFEGFVFNGIPQKIDLIEFNALLLRDYPEAIINARLLLKMEDVRASERSGIFQTRIPWELKWEDDETYILYGRFSSGVV